MTAEVRPKILQKKWHRFWKCIWHTFLRVICNNKLRVWVFLRQVHVFDFGHYFLDRTHVFGWWCVGPSQVPGFPPQVYVRFSAAAIYVVTTRRWRLAVVFFDSFDALFAFDVATPVELAMAFFDFTNSFRVVAPSAAHYVASVRSFWIPVAFSSSGSQRAYKAETKQVIAFVLGCSLSFYQSRLPEEGWCWAPPPKMHSC